MKKAAAVSSRNVCFAVRLRKASYKNSTFKLSLSLLAVTMSFWGVSYADDCTDIMNTANDELQNSFAKGNEASAKGDSATALEKKACDSKDPALRAQIDTLRGEQKQL